jgi:putative addiction module component (TIGR02574 family)
VGPGRTAAQGRRRTRWIDPFRLSELDRRLPGMSLSASEFFEAGMSLPPSVREDVALRLLESLEAVGQESVDESWTAEIASRVDEVVSGEVRMVPGEDVFAELADRRAARRGARDA